MVERGFNRNKSGRIRRIGVLTQGLLKGDASVTTRQTARTPAAILP